MPPRPTHSGARIGLVLGAGGSVGCAYHAGVLFSIQHHLGWDPREAEAIVGTSAGSVIGSLLRAGLSAEDLVALFTGASPSPEHRDVVEEFQAPASAHQMSSWQALLRLRPPTPLGVLRAVRHRSLTPAALSMARHGRHDLADTVAGIERINGGGWPDRPLFLCAANDSTGRRRVLSKHSGIGLADAVRASCAVPGLIAPVVHDGETLLDGGVHSTTNVDVIPHTVDEVWVIAPMAGPAGGTSSWRWLVETRLRRELGTLPKHMPVRVFAPGAATVRTMGLDLMAPDRGTSTVREAFLETGDRLGAERVRRAEVGRTTGAASPRQLVHHGAGDER